MKRLNFIFLYLIYTFSCKFGEAYNSVHPSKEIYVIRYFEGQKIIPVTVKIDLEQQTEHVISLSSKGWKSVTFYDFSQNKVAYKDPDTSQCFVADLEGETLEADRKRLAKLNGGIVKGFYVPTFVIHREVTNTNEINEECGERISLFCNGTTVFYVTRHSRPGRKKRDTARSGNFGRNGQFTHHSYGHYGHQSNNYAHYGHETHVTGTVDKDGNIRNQNVSHHQVRSESSQTYPSPSRASDSQTHSSSRGSALRSPQQPSPISTQFGSDLPGKNFSPGQFGSGQFSLQTAQESGYQLNLPLGLTAGNAYRGGIRSQGQYGVGGTKPHISTDFRKYPDGQMPDSSSYLAPIPGGYERGVARSPSPFAPSIPTSHRVRDGFISPSLTQTGHRIASDLGRDGFSPVIPQTGRPSESDLRRESGHVVTPQEGIDPIRYPGSLAGYRHGDRVSPTDGQHDTSILRGSRPSEETLTPHISSQGQQRIPLSSEISGPPRLDTHYPTFSRIPGSQSGIITPGSVIPSTQNGYPSHIRQTPTVPGSGYTPADPGSEFRADADRQLGIVSHRMPGGQILQPAFPGYRPITYPVGPPGSISSRPDLAQTDYIQRIPGGTPAMSSGIEQSGMRQTDVVGQGARGFITPSGVGTLPGYISAGEPSTGIRMPSSGTHVTPLREVRGPYEGPSVPPGSPSYAQPMNRSTLPGYQLPAGERSYTGYPPVSPSGFPSPGHPIPGQISYTGYPPGYPSGFSPPGYPIPGQSIGVDPRSTVPHIPDTSRIPGTSISELQEPGSSLIPGGEGPFSSQTQSVDSVRSDGRDSASSQTQIQTGLEGTAAEASSAGQHRGHGSQTQVQGGYTGNGSFSAQAQSGFTGGATQSQVQGGRQGGLSGSSALVERVGSAQSQVQVGQPSGAASSSAQGRFSRGMTQVQAQSGRTGGSAGSESQSSGLSSSQVQVNIGGEEGRQQNGFRGTVSASVHGGHSSGQSQTQLQGGYDSGRTYVATAQGGFDSALGFQGSVPAVGAIPKLLPQSGRPSLQLPSQTAGLSGSVETGGTRYFPSSPTGVSGQRVHGGDDGQISALRTNGLVSPSATVPGHANVLKPVGPLDDSRVRSTTGDRSIHTSRDITSQYGQIPSSYQPSTFLGALQPRSADTSRLLGTHQTELKQPVSTLPSYSHYQPVETKPLDQSQTSFQVPIQPQPGFQSSLLPPSLPESMQPGFQPRKLPPGHLPDRLHPSSVEPQTGFRQQTGLQQPLYQTGIYQPPSHISPVVSSYTPGGMQISPPGYHPGQIQPLKVTPGVPSYIPGGAQTSPIRTDLQQPGYQPGLIQPSSQILPGVSSYTPGGPQISPQPSHFQPHSRPLEVIPPYIPGVSHTGLAQPRYQPGHIQPPSRTAEEIPPYIPGGLQISPPRYQPGHIQPPSRTPEEIPPYIPGGLQIPPPSYQPGHIQPPSRAPEGIPPYIPGGLQMSPPRYQPGHIQPPSRAPEGIPPYIPGGSHTGLQQPGYQLGQIQPPSHISGVPAYAPGDRQISPPRTQVLKPPGYQSGQVETPGLHAYPSGTGRSGSPVSRQPGEAFGPASIDRSSPIPGKIPGAQEPDLTDEGGCCDALRNLKKRCCGRSHGRSGSSCCSNANQLGNNFDLDEDFDESTSGEPCKVVKAICYIVYKPVGKARICKPTATNGC